MAELTLQGSMARFAKRMLSGDPLPREIIIDGPAGTSKTWSIGLVVRALLEKHPRVRGAMVRKVRADIANSVGRTWEEFILGPDHYLVAGAVKRENRISYQFNNGSELFVGGLDRDTRLFSTEFDFFWVNEGIELSEANWEYLSRALRNYKLPGGQFRLMDTNPVEPSNWVNRRGDREDVYRVVTSHRDNPAYFRPGFGWTAKGIDYVETLRTMSGVRRDRLLYGKWVAAEGAIWPEFDRSVHVRPRSECPKQFRYYIGSQDFGTRAPGCFQVWGVDRKAHGDVMWLLYEVYQTGKDTEWWAAEIAEAYTRFPMQRIVCDHEPDRIEFQNRYLARGDFRAPAICTLAKKDRTAGNQVVRAMLNPNQIGGPRIFFCEDALVRTDPELMDSRRPTKTIDEIDSYVFREPKNEEDKALEIPDPNCVDHGCFPAGTMVATPDGEVPIESLCAGDAVFTPNGPEPVTDAMMTNPLAQTIVVKHSLGEFRCTPDHPVFVDGVGFKRADELRYGMILACVTSASNTTACGGTATPNQKTGAICITGRRSRANQSGCIGISGRSIAGRSRMGTRYTISTATAQTTASTTSNALRQSSTARRIWSTSRGFIKPARTEGWKRSVWRNDGAPRATSRWTRRSRRAPQLARTRANHACSEKRTHTTTSVIRTETSSRCAVYNLTVGTTHAFYADGVLVSNCDTLRYSGMEVYSADPGVRKYTNIERRKSSGIIDEVYG
jgi:PBSX family phage terminase large subunit